MERSFYFSLLLWILIQASGSAEEKAVDAEARAAARRVWQVVETILDNHTAPPTRQQMLQMGIRQMGIRTTGHRKKTNNEERDRQLARSISELSRQSETEDFLASQLSSASQSLGVPVEQLEVNLIQSTLSSVPGVDNYIPAKDAAVDQQLRANRYVGIGIALGMKDDYPCMNKVFPRGPAHRAGAKENDLIVSIDGADTQGMALAAVVPKLRGNAGIPVAVAVRQPDSEEVRKLTILRGEVPIETVVGREQNPDLEWNYHVVPDEKEIAYLKLKSIRGSTVNELREAAQKLRAQGFRSVILDLRGVEDGELRHAAMVADLLIEEKPLGAAVIRGHRQEFKSNADNLFSSWPIAVIIDPNTIGQAEWIAANLQERRNTSLVGIQTRGAGYISEQIKLPDGGAIALRTGQFFRPDGRSLVSEGTNIFPPMLVRTRQRLPQVAYQQAATPPEGWNGLTPDVSMPGDSVQLAITTLRKHFSDADGAAK